MKNKKMIFKIIFFFIGEILIYFFFFDITFFAGWLEDTDPDFDPRKYDPWYKKSWKSIALDVGIPILGMCLYFIIFYGFDGSWILYFVYWVLSFFKN